jgi:tRNA(fMet)-specific endonuclease VapC
LTIALDTNVVIDLLRRRSLLVRQRFLQASAREPLLISLIVFHELRYGVAASPRPAAHRAQLDFLLKQLKIEPLSEKDVIAAAEIRARLKAPGRGIGPYDSLIAGQALNRGWTLVTANTREFERVEGLNIEDWALPAT